MVPAATLRIADSHQRRRPRGCSSPDGVINHADYSGGQTDWLHAMD